MYFCGCDLGSATGKAVIINEEGIVSWAVIGATRSPELTATEVLNEALEKAGLKEADISLIIGTGYGREGVSYIQKNMSEISCHAKGAFSLDPSVRTIIDIGGQDSKVISLNDTGKVSDFQMNDKCAAGTGRFFENMCRVLNCSLDELSAFAMKAEKPCVISKQCGIFAESEVISLLNKGEDISNISAGLHNSVARRILSLANRIGIEETVTVTGGCARNDALVRSLEDVLQLKVTRLPVNPQIIGALGAALYAKEKIGIPHGN